MNTKEISECLTPVEISVRGLPWSNVKKHDRCDMRTVKIAGQVVGDLGMIIGYCWLREHFKQVVLSRDPVVDYVADNHPVEVKATVERQGCKFVGTYAKTPDKQRQIQELRKMQASILLILIRVDKNISLRLLSIDDFIPNSWIHYFSRDDETGLCNAKVWYKLSMFLQTSEATADEEDVKVEEEDGECQ